MTTATATYSPTRPTGGLSGPAGGTWEQGTVARAQCACCGSWVIDARVWNYWVGPVCKLAVCAPCAEGGDA